jgi:glycosyltransferase involved in cell wall biosynthesis
VLLAAHNEERFLRHALESVIRQTVTDLELIVVDDGSTDSTPNVLASVSDPRVVRVRNEERLGLAGSLNRALEVAHGHYVARLDADDVAFPHRLERQLARMQSDPSLAVLGSAVLELDPDGRPGDLHLMPAGPSAVRWAALFSSPFFHPTVLVRRELLEREAVRYDTEFLESEDYDLWTRLLRLRAGDNLREPLVLYRVHERQASSRRRDIQHEFQRRVALREIAAVAPALDPDRAELAWRVGARAPVDAQRIDEAASAFVELARAFERVHGLGFRPAAAAALVRLARTGGLASARIFREAARLDPALALRGPGRRLLRATRTRRTRREAERWLAELEDGSEARPLRVTAVFPEPTPYRAPLLDRISDFADLELTVLYAAETVAARTWRVEPRHHALFLGGLRIPGAEKILRHDYPLTPGVARALAATRPDVVVVSGWSTFAAQAAVAWCRFRRVPYLLVVESHDEDARPAWRRAIKGGVVPPLVKGSSGVLVTGSLARKSMVARGADSDRVRVFANTVDIDAFADRADELAARRPELREALGARPDDVVVLCVGRLVSDKGMDLLVRAVTGAGDPRLILVLAGEGPERGRLEELARELGVRLVLAGGRPWERIVELYVAAEIFALLSRREPWGVVVNEAAASGLPLVLSEAVGAAHDLLREGENGFLVPKGEVTRASDALRRLAEDPGLRRSFAARSRELARGWGYGLSVVNFHDAVHEAAARSRG